MVFIFNGLGGVCVVVLVYVELVFYYSGIKELDMAGFIIILLVLLIGGIFFIGSMLVFVKLQGLVWDSIIILFWYDIVNMVLFLIMLGMGGYFVVSGVEGGFLMGFVFMVLALVYGFFFVVFIGGVDMLVVIFLLNFFIGFLVVVIGLIYGFQFMFVGGILVGVFGMIFIVFMCEAMNCFLINVFVGGFGGGGVFVKGVDGEQVVKEVIFNDVVIQLFYF